MEALWSAPFVKASALFPAALPRMQNGETFSLQDWSDALQTNVTRIFVPMQIGDVQRLKADEA